MHRMLHTQVCTYKNKLPGPTITAKSCTQIPNRRRKVFCIEFSVQCCTLRPKTQDEGPVYGAYKNNIRNGRRKLFCIDAVYRIPLASPSQCCIWALKPEKFWTYMLKMVCQSVPNIEMGIQRGTDNLCRIFSAYGASLCCNGWTW